MPTTAPEKKKKVAVKAIGEKGLMDTLMTRLKASIPRKKGEPTYDLMRPGKTKDIGVKYVIPLEIDGFDTACGFRRYPGVPVSRITELFGLEMSGKTAAALKLSANAKQKKVLEILPDGTCRPLDPETYNVTVLYLDNEQSFADEERVTVDGVLLDCILARTDTVDQLFRVIDVTISHIHEHELADKSKKIQIVVVVIDTIAGTASKEELSQEWGKQDYSRQALQLRQGFRKLMRKITRYNVALIATNQVSDSFAPKTPKKGPVSLIPSEKDFNAFGGKALKFYARLRIFFFQVNDNYKLHPKSRNADGLLVGFYVKKNSQAAPARQGRMVILYKGGYSRIYSLLEQMLYLKAAEYGDKGAIGFRFKAMGVTPSTFGAAPETTLEGDDDEESGTKRKVKGNPKIPNRLAWPAFYEAHKADFDLMWYACQSAMFAASDDLAIEDGEDDEDDEEVDDELDEDLDNLDE